MIDFKSIQTPSLLIVKESHAFNETSNDYISLQNSSKKGNKILLLLNFIESKSNNVAVEREYVCFFNGKIKKFLIYPGEENIFSLVG